ncbi:MAG: 1-acyl-sn-glycerol-3-phosphate acyltransferase, partial [Limisphaerales bacterium]
RIFGHGLALVSFMFISLFMAVLVFPAIRILPGTKEAKGRRVRRIICNGFRIFLKCCNALQLIHPARVIGREHLEQAGPFIVVANHPTIFDIVVLGSLIPDFNCVVKHKLASSPFLGGCVKAADFVTNDRPQEIIERCMEGFSRSQPLIIFPEGTRSPRVGVHPFSRGAAHLALRSKLPIITAILKCDPPGFTKQVKWYAVPPRAMQYTVEFSKHPPSLDTDSPACLSSQARELTTELEQFFRHQLGKENSPAKENYRPAILIPNHNHKDAIVPLLDRLAVYGIDCLIVDDGSEPGTQRVLEKQAAERAWVQLIRRPQQGGKGAAVMDGLRWLREAGYTHAVQMDADGQHDSADLPKFLRESETHPTSLVLGKPTYGPDVPRIRLAGRQLSRVLVWLETFSFAISDPLLGYRVYPIEQTVGLMNRSALGQRMDFDPEIVVRLKWDGMPVRNIPTRVCYPPNGLSNFRFVADNASMISLHTRLLLSLLLRPFTAFSARRGNA